MGKRKHLAGEVSLLGRTMSGSVPHGAMSELWGAVIGGGLAVGTGATVRAVATSPSWQSNSDLIGFSVGGVASAAMMVFPGTRAAGLTGLLAAFLTNGVRQIESWLAKPAALPQPAPATQPGVQGALGVATVQRLAGGGLGVPVVNQLGLATVANQPRSRGTIPGVAGPFAGTAGVAQPAHLPPPVSLLGAPNAQHAQARLLGGAPALHGLASHYGANLFSHG